MRAIQNQPAWIEHLGGGVIDNDGPKTAFDLKTGNTPSAISLTGLDGEQSIMIGELTAKSFQTRA